MEEKKEINLKKEEKEPGKKVPSPVSLGVIFVFFVLFGLLIMFLPEIKTKIDEWWQLMAEKPVAEKPVEEGPVESKYKYLNCEKEIINGDFTKRYALKFSFEEDKLKIVEFSVGLTAKTDVVYQNVVNGKTMFETSKNDLSNKTGFIGNSITTKTAYVYSETIDLEKAKYDDIRNAITNNKELDIDYYVNQTKSEILNKKSTEGYSCK